MDPPAPVVILSDVVAGYGRGAPVLDGISLIARPGEVIGVLGASGSGKTTILRIISGFIKPWKGKAMVCHRDTADPGLSPADHLRDIGIIFQSGALFDSLSVWDNVAFGIAEDPDLTRRQIEKLVTQQLRFVGIEELADHFPSEISGGQARRVALARALALSPRVMLYDEPFGGLDPVTAIQVGDQIRRVGNKGVCSILVSHRVEHVGRIADRAVLLRNGKIRFDGPPADLLMAGDPIIEAFLNTCGKGAWSANSRKR